MPGRNFSFSSSLTKISFRESVSFISSQVDADLFKNLQWSFSPAGLLPAQWSDISYVSLLYPLCSQVINFSVAVFCGEIPVILCSLPGGLAHQLHRSAILSHGYGQMDGCIPGGAHHRAPDGRRLPPEWRSSAGTGRAHELVDDNGKTGGCKILAKPGQQVVVAAALDDGVNQCRRRTPGESRRRCKIQIWLTSTEIR